MSPAYPTDAREHLEIVEHKLQEMRVRAKHPPRDFWTLNGMVRSWRAVVAKIEVGYDEIIEDYWNDVSVRDLLEELLAVIPEGSVRSWVMQEIEQTDGRFRAATHAVERPIFGSGVVAWWWMRVPNVLVGELRRDFEGGLAD